MPVVIKRVKKYFPGREMYFVPSLYEENMAQSESTLQVDGDSELLRTIKL